MIKIPDKYDKTYLHFILIIFPAAAQPHYTKLRAGVNFELSGIAPIAMIAADMPFKYNSKGFWNLQAGIGLIPSINSKPTFSTSSAISYNFLLNPYHRSLCSPAPEYNRFESYLETGLALSVFNPYYHALPEHLQNNSYLSPAGLIGLRMHYVREKWIYILKVRLTPFIDRKLAVWGGAGIGLGWH